MAQPPGDHACVKTTQPEAAAAVRIGSALGRRKRAELLDLLRPCFTRTEPWLQAGKYAAAVMCDLRRRNGWTIAERSGDRTPDRTQRLLNRAVWDTWAAMGWCAGSPWPGWMRPPGSPAGGAAWRWARSMKPGRSRPAASRLASSGSTWAAWARWP